MASRTFARWLVSMACFLTLLPGWNLAAARPVPVATTNNTVYEIFVRSWADSPRDTDHVGDLKGIRENLNYLNDGNPATHNDLEVGIVWLMPIFPATSYHGYDVTDYRNVNPEYGTLKDLKDLLDAAHKRGVRIILDIPFNHTSNRHPWFLDAVNNPSSRFRNFYHFAPIDQPAPAPFWYEATAADGRKTRYMGFFSPTMPDLDFTKPEVRKEVKDIAKFWLDFGVDGFRLDAAKHIFGKTTGTIPEPDILRNNDWWREFSDFVYRIKPAALVVGEVLGPQETLRRHSYGLDALLDEPFMNSCRNEIAFPAPNLVTDWKSFVNKCREVNVLAHQGPGALARDEPFWSWIYLSSHDANPRLASFLDEKKGQGMQASVDEAYRLGMYLLTSLDKYPILYYGDEIMQRGWKWNGNPPTAQPPGDGSLIYDETLREPFPWRKVNLSPPQAPQTQWSPALPKFDRSNDGISVEEQDRPGEMLSLVRGLTNLRADHPGYANGELGDILTDSADWLVYEKVSPQERYLVLINPTATGKNYNFHQGWYPRYLDAQLIFWSDGGKREWRDESNANKRIGNSVFVPPYGMVVIEQK